MQFQWWDIASWSVGPYLASSPNVAFHFLPRVMPFFGLANRFTLPQTSLFPFRLGCNPKPTSTPLYSWMEKREQERQRSSIHFAMPFVHHLALFYRQQHQHVQVRPPGYNKAHTPHSKSVLSHLSLMSISDRLQGFRDRKWWDDFFIDSERWQSRANDPKCLSHHLGWGSPLPWRIIVVLLRDFRQRCPVVQICQPHQWHSLIGDSTEST